jgi:threonine synthase
VASAIRIGRPASWATAVAAVTESGGEFRAVTDAEILEARGEIARREGIFCEPASAAGVAGLRASVAAGRTPAACRCVCVCTGHGLKDAASVPSIDASAPAIPATVEAVAAALGL